MSLDAGPRASFEELEIRTRDGVSLRAVVEEPRDGAELVGTCVLAHAMFARKSEWGRRERPGVAQAWAALGWRTVAFDFRGHGDSDPSPDGTYSWDGFADDAQAVLEHLELLGDPRLLAVGHSKGATSLMTVAWRRPGTIPRIWAFEPIVFPQYDAALQDPDNPMSASARRRRAVWPSRDA
ncbi:MAG TPA: alpha/beta fold hydrolase, partial [Labilithrix sp.]